MSIIDNNRIIEKGNIRNEEGEMERIEIVEEERILIGDGMRIVKEKDKIEVMDKEKENIESNLKLKGKNEKGDERNEKLEGREIGDVMWEEEKEMG